MAKKIADQLIETLADTGIERIYAVTGDSLNEVNEAVRKNDKIKCGRRGVGNRYSKPKN